jgi:UDP-glucose 4-epimerase
MKMRILVTGGAGYIGSHTCVLLLEAGYEVIVFDNFSNSSRESLCRVEEITGKQVDVIEGDIRERSDLKKAFERHKIDAVIHFAGLKAGGDIAKCYADPSYAKEVLGWEAKRGIDEMCEDTWRWQSMNPNGYDRTRSAAHS